MRELLRRLRFPHPLVLLVIGALLAAVLTHILPAGEYRRVEDPVLKRLVVVPNSYAPVAASPVSLFGALVAIPKGMVDGASIIFFIFLIGGAFSVVDQTGALRRGVDWLARRIDTRALLVIPIVSVCFAVGGGLENMEEEIIALVPALLLLVRRLGFDALTAAAMSGGTAMVAASFSPVNPFQVLLAQQLSAVPALSGAGFRTAFLAIALAIWIGWTMRHARRTRTQPEREPSTQGSGGFSLRDGVVLGLVIAGFAVFILGVTRFGWDFDQDGALFFAVGVLAGWIGGLGLSGTATAFAKGFADMAMAALLVGFARSISVVLMDGKVLDTIVRGLLAPVANFPLTAAAGAMVGVHLTVHVLVPSVSGQAALTMPVMVPLADLLGLSRQVVVLAYQYGAGLCELFTPTNGALMAILAAAGVGFGQWLRFTIPALVALLGLGLLAIGVAIAIGLT